MYIKNKSYDMKYIFTMGFIFFNLGTGIIKVLFDILESVNFGSFL
jgi:hypothetical protein